MPRIVAAVVCLACALTAQETRRDLEQVASRDEAVWRPAAARLVQAGVASLEAYRDHVADMDSRYWLLPSRFAREVLPELDPGPAGAFLLDELRRHLPLLRRVEAATAARLAEHPGGTPEGGWPLSRWERWSGAWVAEYTRPEVAADYTWAQTTVSWLGWLGHREAWDELRALYRELDLDSGLRFQIFWSLWQLDENAMRAELLAAVRDGSGRVRGSALHLLTQRGEQLPRELLPAVLADEAPEVLRVIPTIVSRLERSDLDTIVSLVTHTDEFVARIALYRLQQLSELSPPGVQAVEAGAGTPEARAAAWRQWFAAREGASRQDLLLAAIDDALARGPEAVDEVLLQRLDPEQVPREKCVAVLRVALQSAYPQYRGMAAVKLCDLHLQGAPGAADALLSHCRELAYEQVAGLAPQLARLEDPRVEELLLGWLEGYPQRGHDPWIQSVVGAYAQVAGPRAVDNLWALHESSGLPIHRVLGTLEGADRLVPPLMKRLLTSQDRRERVGARTLLDQIGGAAVGQAALAGLREVPGDPGYDLDSPRADLFLLLAEHPIAEARPFLLEMLAGHRFPDHLGAARVLDRMGDLAGVSRLIEDLDASDLTGHETVHVPATIGMALRGLKTAGVAALLRAAHDGATGAARHRVRVAMLESKLPDFLDLWVEMLDAPGGLDRDQLVQAVKFSLYGHDPREFEDAEMAAVAAAARWFFADEPLPRTEEELPWPERRHELQHVVLIGNMMTVLHFDREGAKVERMTDDWRSAIAELGAYSAGYAWYRRDRYAMARVSLSLANDADDESGPRSRAGGTTTLEASYLFVRDEGGAWKPRTVLHVGESYAIE